jgi:predicted nuclease of restriction endonuclease-like (RecB) superfamily
MLEFLGSTNAGSTQETNLEQALIHQLQAFLLELELRAKLGREQAAIEERLLDQVPL